MWPKRKETPSSEIPKLQEEYLRLLRDTLSDIRPLQDVSQPRNDGGRAEATVQSQWQAHQRALRPGVETTHPARTRRFVRPEEDRLLETASMGR